MKTILLVISCFLLFGCGVECLQSGAYEVEIVKEFSTNCPFELNSNVSRTFFVKELEICNGSYYGINWFEDKTLECQEKYRIISNQIAYADIECVVLYETNRTCVVKFPINLRGY